MVWKRKYGQKESGSSSGAGEGKGKVKVMGHDDEWLFPEAWHDGVAMIFFTYLVTCPHPLPCLSIYQEIVLLLQC